jgi:hypothetical protein
VAVEVAGAAGVVDAVVVPSLPLPLPLPLPQAASRMPSASGVIKVFANLTRIPWSESEVRDRWDRSRTGS